ncbi:MAG: polysaccharide deacetylase family protein [Bacteroidia bacterium]|nr:polysaccharide deacetylase family protein [Bacteroidia bacterium]
MVRNFLFHRISPDRDPLWDPMDPDLFSKCLRHISENYDVITIEDLPHAKLHEQTATISFDDGYKDNIEVALPILEKYRVKASFYVATDCIDNQTPTWTYYLEHLFKNTQKPELNIDFEYLPEGMRVKQLQDYNSRIAYVKKLKPLLKNLTLAQRREVVLHVSGIYNDVEKPNVMMTWEDLKKLRQLGHQVGSHTKSHTMLGHLSDETRLIEELKGSRDRIFEMLGENPKTISYPNGSYNQRVTELSKEYGYLSGLAVKQDVYIPGRDSIFEIPRIELYNEPWWKTKLRISNSLERIKKVLRYK